MKAPILFYVVVGLGAIYTILGIFFGKGDASFIIGGAVLLGAALIATEIAKLRKEP